MTCPAESSRGAPGAATMPRAAAPTGATLEVMAGMPSAGPLVMVVPTPMTAPGTEPSTRSAPSGRRVRV